MRRVIASHSYCVSLKYLLQCATLRTNQIGIAKLCGFQAAWDATAHTCCHERGAWLQAVRNYDHTVIESLPNIWNKPDFWHFTQQKAVFLFSKSLSLDQPKTAVEFRVRRGNRPDLKPLCLPSPVLSPSPCLIHIRSWAYCKDLCGETLSSWWPLRSHAFAAWEHNARIDMFCKLCKEILMLPALAVVLVSQCSLCNYLFACRSCTTGCESCLIPVGCTWIFRSPRSILSIIFFQSASSL